MDSEQKIQEAVDRVERYWGACDGENHKQWLIDQTLRSLLGAEQYEKWVAEYNAYTDENGESYAPWEEGIAP